MRSSKGSTWLDLISLLKVPYLDPDLGFDISSSNSRVAFSWNKTGRWEIYICDLEGDTNAEMITQGAGGKFAPRWNPAGNLLAYALDLDGSETYDLWLYNLESETHENLTPNTQDAILTSFAWSPDGSQIAFISDREGCFHTYLMSSSGGEARQIFAIPYPDWEVFWSPDGSKLAVVSEGTGQDSWIHIIPLDGGDPYPIQIGETPLSAKHPCWSPDGNLLALSSDDQGQFEIACYDIARKSLAWLTSGPGEKEKPAWSDEGTLAYVISYGPQSELAVMDLSSSKVDSFQIEPGVVYSPKFSPSDNEILIIFDNPRHPDDMWILNRKTRSFNQLTESLPPAIQSEVFVMPEEVNYPGLDGVEVPALLYLPRREEKMVPAVIYIHGGPNWLTQITWDPLLQHMVSRGWAVLAPNYRGSTGYGREWMNANRFDLGGVDTDDVAAGWDFLVDQEIADPAKIGLTGRSWGGYLTMTCLTRYPNKWAAGAAVVPFLNWFTSHENSREDLQHWDRENFGDPVVNKDLWYDRSPYFFLDQIQAPVQLICGQNDVRCPASESKQAYETLKELERDPEYHLYEDEGHFFLKIENQIKSKTQVVDFLGKYLD
jgi:dipeptidyl aminopeptidase/acylaminoacyl peptidase